MKAVRIYYKIAAKNSSFFVNSVDSGVDLGPGIGSVSITTIDTKTGEIKQISQEELGKLLDENRENGGDTPGNTIDTKELQKILDNFTKY